MKTHPLPLVSILIPAYNPRYFQEALRSAQEQTYPNIEIIVCDDSADQRIAEIVRSSPKLRLHYEKNPVRLHGRGNLNKCLEMAQGDYIKFLNDDDRLAPHCVEKLISPLIQNPGLSLATSKRRRIDGAGNLLPDSEATLAPVKVDSVLHGPTACKAILESMTNFIGEPSTVLVRRNALPPCGTDAMSYHGTPIYYLNDIAMWFSALEYGDAVYLTEPLSDFRVHSEQNQQNDQLKGMTLPNYRLLCKLALDHGLISSETMSELELRPRMIPGWATLFSARLNKPETHWQEYQIYFGPERIADGATTALLNEEESGPYTEFDWQTYRRHNPDINAASAISVTDHFILHGQFEYRPGTPKYSHKSTPSTRQCTNLWNQLLVDASGNARPCLRYDHIGNIHATDFEDGLRQARLSFITGRPFGPCENCDLHPLAPLRTFIQHNFTGQQNLLAPRPNRVLVNEAPTGVVHPEHMLVVGHSAGRAGGEFVALAIVRTLKEDFGCKVSLILARGGELEADFRRYADIYLEGNDLSGPEATRSLLAKLRLEGVRHAICNTAVVGRYAAWLKESGFQVVHLVHELGTSIERFLPQEDRHGLCDGPDTLVFPVDFVKSSFLDRYAPRTARLHCHPQGIEPDFERPADRTDIRLRLRNKLGLPTNSRLVIGAGSGELRKGPDLFLQVAQRVLTGQQYPYIHFVWLGQLDAVLTSWIEHDCRGLNLSNHFHLAGLQTDLTDFYLGADIFLMTSREDPLPNVVIESMYAGLPVIAFEGGGGTPELLTEGCGCTVPYMDLDAMARTVRQLLDEPELAMDIGARAAAKIEAGFRRTDYVEYLLSHYRDPVHTLTLVFPGKDQALLNRQLESLAKSLDRFPWYPDALLFTSASANITIPQALKAIPRTHLELPPDTPHLLQLRAASQNATTELLWYMDLFVEQIESQLLACLSCFDAPDVVVSFGPGHDPATRESLPPVASTLLSINERQWLQPGWQRRNTPSALHHGSPVLSLSSTLLRRCALNQAFTTKTKSLEGNPLWFWPVLVAMSRTGTIVWSPRPLVTQALSSLPGLDDTERWWQWWNDAFAHVSQFGGQTAASAAEQTLDRHKLREALGIKIVAQEKKAGPVAIRASLSPHEELAGYEKACKQLEKGRLDKAEALLNEQVRQGSTLWQIHFELGRIAFEREQADAAINHFRTAASLEFTSTNALRSLVVIYSMVGEYGAALAATGLILRQEDDPELINHLKAVVTEASVSMDGLAWASPKWEKQLKEQQEALYSLQGQLEDARQTIATLDRQLLLARAGLTNHATPTSTPANLQESQS